MQGGRLLELDVELVLQGAEANTVPREGNSLELRLNGLQEHLQQNGSGGFKNGHHESVFEVVAKVRPGADERCKGMPVRIKVWEAFSGAVIDEATVQTDLRKRTKAGAKFNLNSSRNWIPPGERMLVAEATYLHPEYGWCRQTACERTFVNNA